MNAARDFGPKPELCWLPTSKLFVDRRYQRTLESRRSQKLIERIVTGFKWNRFKVVLVAKADEEGLHSIIDGQHRAEAAKRLRIAEVPCSVTEAGSLTEQALAFVSANRDRVTVNGFALHHALVAAGDENAMRIERLCRATGVDVPRYPIPLNNLKANQTLGLGAIAKLAKLSVADGERVLHTLREAFPSIPGALRSHLILGVAALFEEAPRLMPALVVASLKRFGLDALESEIGDRVRSTGEVRAFAAREIIKLALGGSIPAAKPQAPSPKPMPQGEALLPAGMPNKPNNGGGLTKAEVSAAANLAIDNFIAKHGVTKCPTAVVAPTEGAVVAKADKDAHAKRHAGLEEERQRKWRSQHPTRAGRP